MSQGKRPRRSPDRPAYPRRGALAWLGGAASLSVLGCTEKPSKPIVRDEPIEPPDPISSVETTKAHEGSEKLGPSPKVATPTSKRLPEQGFRTLSLGAFETVHYAVTLTHDDARFGECVDGHTDALLEAADAGVRALPPYAHRDDAVRARTEAKISERIASVLSKEGGIETPLASVKLEVQRFDRRPRRTAGITPRHSP